MVFARFVAIFLSSDCWVAFLAADTVHHFILTGRHLADLEQAKILDLWKGRLLDYRIPSIFQDKTSRELSYPQGTMDASSERVVRDQVHWLEAEETPQRRSNRSTRISLSI